MTTKPAPNGTTTTTTTTTTPLPPANKSHLYNPTSRPPFRPPPYRSRGNTRGRSIQCSCCRCCFWTAIIILVLLVLAATASVALYIVYRPHRPEFSISSFRIQRLKLTTTPTSASVGHLTTIMNLTMTSNNPNKNLAFIYDSFSISSLSSDVLLGNGTLPGFIQDKQSSTNLPGVIISGSNALDAESVNSLNSALKTNGGGGSAAVSLKVLFDTKVTVEVGKLKSKKVGIRVTCDGISGTVPKGKSPTVAVTSGSKCKVDLRIKIWKFTL